MAYTSYNDDMQSLADWYANDGWKELDEATPTMSGLARQLGVTRRTLYLWREKHDAFREVCETLQDSQEFSLINGGLGGKLNSNIVKLMLANHGYSDKVSQDVTSSDGSVGPTRIELVAPEPKE